MPRPSNQSGPRRTGHPLYTFVNSSHTESRIARRLAENSTLPNFSLHRNPLYLGFDPSSVGASRSVNKDRSTHLESAPTLDSSTGQSFPSASVLTPEAALSDFGCGVEIEGHEGRLFVDSHVHDFLRQEVEAQGGALWYIPQTWSIHHGEPDGLECPFRRFGCDEGFSFDMEHEWIVHSLDHYMRDGFGLDRAEPPQRNQCPFCLEIFVDVSGEVSWVQRMRHVASEHHIHGESLARHARTDFTLLSYLWKVRAIDIDTFRDYCGPEADPSYGTRSQASGATTPRAGTGMQGPEEAVSVMYERRRGTRRRNR